MLGAEVGFKVGEEDGGSLCVGLWVAVGAKVIVGAEVGVTLGEEDGTLVSVGLYVAVGAKVTVGEALSVAKEAIEQELYRDFDPLDGAPLEHAGNRRRLTL